MGLARYSFTGQRAADCDKDAAVQDELSHSASDIEYRRLWKLLHSKGVFTRREHVKQFLLRLDLEGILKNTHENSGEECMGIRINLINLINSLVLLSMLVLMDIWEGAFG